MEGGATGCGAGSQRNDDGSVSTPEGIPEAYQKLVEAGWGAISFDPEYAVASRTNAQA